MECPAVHRSKLQHVQELKEVGAEDAAVDAKRNHIGLDKFRGI